MTAPSESDLIRFLEQLQRLLVEGRFSTTYKYALLLSLAELAVERGADDGSPLVLSIHDLADKFIALYWRQTSPFGGADGVSEVLYQSHERDREARVLRLLAEMRAVAGDNISSLRTSDRYSELRREVARTIREQPLWKLQRVEPDVIEFLYPQVGSGSTVELRGSAVVGFRRFRAFVAELVESAWVRFVREVARNRVLIGPHADLHEHLFGRPRAALAQFGDALADLQSGRCLYCDAAVDRGVAEVDHFIPWARYPSDLGHNLVLSHATCNARKSDLLAAEPHIERWCERNALPAARAAFDGAGITHHFATTLRVADWAYSTAERRQESVWRSARSGSERVRLTPEWARILRASG
jgi:hypothetical protein